MTKKLQKGFSGSEHIRRWHDENPGTTLQDTVIGLRKQGIKVTTGLVSHVRSACGYSKKINRGKKKKKQKNTLLRTNSANTLDLTDLKAARGFIQQVGGPDRAVEVVQNAVATIKTLQSILN